MHEPFDEPEYELPHRGKWILLLGVLSVSCFSPVGIAAWVMGNSDLRAIREGRMDPTGRHLTEAGVTLGMIAAVFLLPNTLILGSIYTGLLLFG